MVCTEFRNDNASDTFFSWFFTMLPRGFARKIFIFLITFVLILISVQGNNSNKTKVNMSLNKSNKRSNCQGNYIHKYMYQLTDRKIELSTSTLFTCTE